MLAICLVVSIKLQISCGFFFSKVRDRKYLVFILVRDKKEFSSYYFSLLLKKEQ